MITKSRSTNHFPTVPLTHIDNDLLQSLQSPETTTSVSPTQSSKILPIPFPRIERTPPDKSHKKNKRDQYPINYKSNETYFVTPHKLFDVSRPSVSESKPVIHQLPSPMGLVDPTSALRQLYQPVGFHYDSDEDDRVSEESSPGGEDALTPQVTGNQQQQSQQIPPGYASGPISDLQAFLRLRNNSGTPFRMESLTAEQLKATAGNFVGGQNLETLTLPSSTEQSLNQDHVQDILNRFKPVMNTSLPQHPMIPTDSGEEEERPFVHLPAQIKASPHPSSGFRKFSIPSTPAASVTSSMTTNPPAEEVRHPMVPVKSYQGMNKFKQTTPSHQYLNRAYTTNVATTISPDQNFNPQDHSSGNHYGHPDPRYNNGKNAENQSPQTQDYSENEQMNRAPPQKSPTRRLPDKMKERFMKPRDQTEIQEKQDPSSEPPSRDLDQEEKRRHVHYNDNPPLQQQHQSNSNNNKNNNRGKSGQVNRPSKVKQSQSPTPPSTHVYSHSKYYTMDDDFLSKLTTAADTNKANHAPSEDSEGNDDHIPPSKEGTLSGNVIRQLGSPISGGPAVGLGYGLPPGAHLHLPHPPFTPPLFPPGPFSPGLLLPPFLPPPPPGPITCCKRYFPQQHILPGLEVGKGIGGGLHGLHSNEVIQTAVGSNEVDPGVTSTTVMASPSSLSKAETFNPASGLDVLSNEIVGKGIGGIPGIPGESFCYQEPVFPHPLYLKQLKLQRLFYPFIIKKKLLFG